MITWPMVFDTISIAVPPPIILNVKLSTVCLIGLGPRLVTIPIAPGAICITSWNTGMPTLSPGSVCPYHCTLSFHCEAV
jgi:hypothetical protein